MCVASSVCFFKATGCKPCNNLQANCRRKKSETGSSEQGFIGSDSYWMELDGVCFFFFCFFPSFLTFCWLLLLPSLVSFHTNSNENNNNDKNSITSISLSVITLFHPFPFLLKLYLTSSAVVRKQDYWYLSEMKVHF